LEKLKNIVLTFYQNLPLHIDPVAFAIGSFSIRWYAIMFLVGFIVVYAILALRAKRGEYIIQNPKSQIRNTILDFLLVAFFSALVGGRIGYVLFYNFNYFLSHPAAIISPYANGSFMGIYGLSYHGALLGVLLGSFIFLRIKKINFWQWADFVVPAVPLGYFFGRIGNFLNGELYGRVTNSPLGMHFASDPNSLRHPSQIYEALLEGLLLFAILWKMRNKKLPSGALLGVYLIGYGALRILAEQFREPDPQIGFLLGYFTLGQILSLGMILAGGLILFFLRKKYYRV
jgi:phosphatidylglycerol:prolipoprotein diacylglycerol transferase